MFLRTALRLAVGFVFFCAVSSAFLAICGWSAVLLAPWTAAVAGLLCALLFDRFAWKSVDTNAFDLWEGVPRWQFSLVVTVLGLVFASAAYCMLKTFSGDPLCHHGITNSILAFGAPVRDLGSPDRLLPYHALGNSLAAILASAVQLLGAPIAVEWSLDAVSLASLAVFLGICSVLFVLLQGVFRPLCLPGPLWLCFVFPMLVFGAGPVALAHLMPDVLHSTDGYPRFESLTFHPLIQYLGRRSAVPGFIGFTVFFSVLLLSARKAFSLDRVPVVIIAACFIVLAYSSLDLFVIAVVILAAGLLFGGLRRSALIGFAALFAAAPFVAMQGGFFTAALFNEALPDAKTFLALEWRAPALVVFFRGAVLGEIPLGEFFSWKILAVEIPWFLAALPLGALLLRRAQASAGRTWVLIALALTAPLLVAPFLLFFAFSPWDLQRLFFWPILFAALLSPFVLQAVCRSGALRVVLAALLLALSCSSAVVRNLILSPNEKELLLGRAASEFRDRLGFDPQKNHIWVSSVGAQDLLFMNGCRVFAPPFGTAGPVYYKYPGMLLDAVVQSRLSAPDTSGATMALLTADDLAFLRAHRKPEDLVVLQSMRIVNNDRPMELFVVRLDGGKGRE